MTTTALARNPHQATLDSLNNRNSALELKREAVNAKAAAKMDAADQAGHDAATFARSAGKTAVIGVKETGRGFKSAAVGAAQAGAGVGFAVAGAAGAVGHGIAVAAKKTVGFIAKGFLAIANTLAKLAGNQPAKQPDTLPSPVPAKPTFAQRMFAKMREKFGASGTSFKASGSHFAEGAKVGVVGTGANLVLATGSSAVAVGRVAQAGFLKVQAASLRGAQAGVAVAGGAVVQADKGNKDNDAVILNGGTRGLAITGQPSEA